MKTLNDVLAHGQRAEDAGDPLVLNWEQVLNNLSLLDHACGGLEQVLIPAFADWFPKDFQDLAPEIQSKLPGARTYNAARREVSRLLTLFGYVEDPWEALRVQIRNVGGEELERRLWALMTPARDAGLAPCDIHADWVWNLDAERGIASPEQELRRQQREKLRVPAASLSTSLRQTLRAAVAAFDELFDIEEIVESGLLSPERIGAAPEYDRLGRRRVALPPTLSRLYAEAPLADAAGLPQLWHAVSVSGALTLPVDPSADELYDLWPQIKELPESLTGISASSWTAYTQRSRRTLLPHLTRPMQDRSSSLPLQLETAISENADRYALDALWHAMLEAGTGLNWNGSIPELLELKTWRSLSRSKPKQMNEAGFRRHLMWARRVLLRKEPGVTDPLRIVIRAWTELPVLTKAALDPIRKTAEKAFLRPQDITPTWLAGIDLDTAQRAEIEHSLHAVFSMTSEASLPISDPIAVAWQSFRQTAREQGFDTSRLGTLAGYAMNDSLLPSQLDRVWAIKVANTLEHRSRVRFRMLLKGLDAMQANPDLVELLYAEPIGDLPDLRMGSSVDLPEEIVCELADLHAALNAAPSTRREGKAALKKLYAAALRQQEQVETLEGLLRLASSLEVDGEALRKANALLNHVSKIRAMRNLRLEDQHSRSLD